MRVSRFLVTVAAVALLSACTQQKWNNNWHDLHYWVDGKPSHMERKWGSFPTGYFAQNHQGTDVLHPPLPKTPKPVQMVMESPVADTSVSVSPLEGVSAAQPATEMDNYGNRIDQVYFADGSSRVGKVDRKHLRHDAKELKTRDNAAVTVVGHSSSTGKAKDPVRRKELNFEMAQKRANAVTHVLTGAGVKPGWVMAISKGDEEPNTDPGKRSQTAADRRVDVFVNDK